MDKPLIIIGSGIAGVSAAEAARRQDPEADILIISQDRFLPYYRLRICEVLDRAETAGQLLLHPQGWYDERRIRLELGAAVAAVEPAEHRIRLGDGRILDYRSLVVASGSQSFVPPVSGIGRPGVHTLWTLQDALDTSAALAKASRVAVIGGGLLGLEAAYHARRRGLPTLIIEKLPRLLADQLDEAGSEVLLRRVRNLAVEVATDADIVELTGTAADPASPVAGVRLGDGREFAADLVLVSIGVRANLAFLAGSGIDVQRRIVTDDRMRTSQPDVFAAGDAAEPNGYWFGLWPVSRAQGQTAGINAAGGEAVFNRDTPPYLVNTMETRIVAQGDKGQPADPGCETDVRLDEAGVSYRKLVYRGGLFSGFLFVGDAFDYTGLQKQLGQPGPVRED